MITKTGKKQHGIISVVCSISAFQDAEEEPAASHCIHDQFTFYSHMPDQLQRNSAYIFQVEPKRGFLIWINVVTTIINKKLSKICVYHLSEFIFPELFFVYQFFFRNSPQIRKGRCMFKVSCANPTGILQRKVCKSTKSFFPHQILDYEHMETSKYWTMNRWKHSA